MCLLITVAINDLGRETFRTAKGLAWHQAHAHTAWAGTPAPVEAAQRGSTDGPTSSQYHDWALWELEGVGALEMLAELENVQAKLAGATDDAAVLTWHRRHGEGSHNDCLVCRSSEGRLSRWVEQGGLTFGQGPGKITWSEAREKAALGEPLPKQPR